jgi:tRNA pseudouridine32 synthase/23S rRNA pseudouridine746 synthase
MVADNAGKAAATRWRKIAEADGQSLVEFQPLSGRTHQIRVHAARGLGAAIVGDPVYSLPDDAELGGMTLPESGMLLHASRLVVPRAPKEAIDVTAPVPDRFGRWLDFLS